MLWYHRDGRRRISRYHVWQIASISRVFNCWACRTCNTLVRYPAIFSVMRGGTQAKPPFFPSQKFCFIMKFMYIISISFVWDSFSAKSPTFPNQPTLPPPQHTICQSCKILCWSVWALQACSFSSLSPANGVLGVHRMSLTSDLLTKTHKFIKFTPIYVKAK